MRDKAVAAALPKHPLLFGVKSRLSMRRHLFALVRRRGLASTGRFAGSILVSRPDAANDEVGDQPHDRRDDQCHQEFAHGCMPFSIMISLFCAFRHGCGRAAVSLVFERGPASKAPRRVVLPTRLIGRTMIADRTT